MSKRLLIIGAGPVGIEAGLLGLKRGYDVSIYEKGRLGEHLLRWEHIRFFTPVKDNVSSLLWDQLPEKPDENSYLSGREFVEKILAPVAQGPLKDRVHEGQEVIAVAKRRMVKTDLPNHPIRADRPFSILIRRNGRDHLVEAEVVMDAGGVFGWPNEAGESGLPVPGEENAREFFLRGIPDVLGKDRARFIGKSTLVVGSGHSAATVITQLKSLADENETTKIHWVVRTDRQRPCVESADDPLPERAAIVTQANAIAENPPAGWSVHRKSALLSCSLHNGRCRVTIGRSPALRELEVDSVLPLTGFHPSLTHASELQVDISRITGGAGGLASALLGITDCLSPITVKPDQLRSGEAGYFLIGHRSYGRLNTFLLKSGREQLERIFSLI